MTVLALGTSIHFYAQNGLGNKICLEPDEMDYFIRQDTLARTLLHDTTNMGIKGRIKDSIALEQRLNIKDLREQIGAQKMTINIKTQYYNDLYITYEKSQKRTRFFKNACAILGGIAILEGTLLVLLNK